MPNLMFPTSEPKLPDLLRRHELLPDFFLIDVGAHGGILPFCRAFGEQLGAIGFDANVEHIELLNASETNPNVRYEAAMIGYENFASLFPAELRGDKAASKNNDPGPRLSFIRANAGVSRRAEPVAASSDAPPRQAEIRYSVDDYVKAHAISSVDMIKVDTDGSDLEVLLGAARTLRECGVLAGHIECPFIGIEHPYSNVFHNIYRVMREQGFSLFALEHHCYSRAALPAQFLGSYFASTLTGQPWWGDALFLRDLADPQYGVMHEFEVTTEKLLKLACLYEVFSLSDCAAELLLKIEQDGRVETAICRELLDALVPSGETYQEYMRRFDNNPESFVVGS